MNLSKCATVALLGAAASFPAQAADPETRPYLSGGYAFTLADSKRDSGDGHGFFAGAGFTVDPNWGFEVSGFSSDFGRDGSKNPNKWSEFGGKLDTQFFYSREASFAPYVGIGVGAVRSKLKGGGDSSTDPSIDAGIGFFHYLRGVAGGRVALRADARYRWLDTDGGTLGEPVARVGIAVAIGNARTATAAIADADSDGVPDDKDLCPGTAAGVKVDAKGCPLDSDGDGVPDGIDQCPGTAPGIAVDETGCPTSLGSGRFKIVGTGGELRFEDAHFDYDQSTLSDYGREMLDDAAVVIVKVAKQYPGLKVDIAGHTDARGTDGYNQALSERRANVVKQYLIRRGVEASRINIYSYGESKPIATNDTNEGRTQNRRAETRTRAE